MILETAVECEGERGLQMLRHCCNMYSSTGRGMGFIYRMQGRLTL